MNIDNWIKQVKKIGVFIDVLWETFIKKIWKLIVLLIAGAIAYFGYLVFSDVDADLEQVDDQEYYEEY